MATRQHQASESSAKAGYISSFKCSGLVGLLDSIELVTELLEVSYRAFR